MRWDEMRQYLSTTDTDTFICPFVHAFLLAMATPARKTFATDFGQMQRRRHHMTTRGLQICSFFYLVSFNIHWYSIFGVTHQYQWNHWYWWVTPAHCVSNYTGCRCTAVSDTSYVQYVVHDVYHGKAPGYWADLCVRCGDTRLRSSSRYGIVVFNVPLDTL